MRFIWLHLAQQTQKYYVLITMLNYSKMKMKRKNDFNSCNYYFVFFEYIYIFFLLHDFWLMIVGSHSDTLFAKYYYVHTKCVYKPISTYLYTQFTKWNIKIKETFELTETYLQKYIHRRRLKKNCLRNTS